MKVQTSTHADHVRENNLCLEWPLIENEQHQKEAICLLSGLDWLRDLNPQFLLKPAPPQKEEEERISVAEPPDQAKKPTWGQVKVTKPKQYGQLGPHLGHTENHIARSCSWRLPGAPGRVVVLDGVLQGGAAPAVLEVRIRARVQQEGDHLPQQIFSLSLSLFCQGGILGNGSFSFGIF